MTSPPALPAPLYATTLPQPWPRLCLLDEGPARVLNRSWMPPRTLIGQTVALHGGRTPRSEAEIAEVRAVLDWANDTQWGGTEDPEDWGHDEVVPQLCTTGIFALARLAGVTTSPDLPWRTREPYAWVLQDLVPLRQPVPCSGSQGVWEVRGDLLARVHREAGLVTSVGVTAGPGSAPVPVEAAAAELVTAVQASPPRQVLVEHASTTFRPGIHVTAVPAHPESGRLYGMAIGHDWITFLVRRVTRQHEGQRQVVDESWTWCSRATPGMGAGSRQQFRGWLSQLEQGRAA